MKSFRSVLFWLHLAAGLVAGLLIGVMCLTGTALAFETELTAWAERDARTVAVPADAPAALPLDELGRRVQQARPDLRNATITLSREPGAAVAFGPGRELAVFVNPYTGEVRQPATTRTRALMRTLLEWHRFLGREGGQRPAGKAINGAANVAFCFLAVSGLYLWLPRTWSRPGVKAIALFNWRLTGKARDFNWHNAIGLWAAPVLIVLTLTALPISYRWAADGIYRLVGEAPPGQGGPPAPGGAMTQTARPALPDRPTNPEAVVDRIRRDFPQWQQITLRPGEKPGAPATATVRERGHWPRTAVTTLTIDAATGEILRREGFADFSAGRQIRTWTRFLHTGQALGWPGQLAAGLASLGGCVLVVTGFMLAFRRFLSRRQRSPA